MRVGKADMKINYKLVLIISLAFNLAFLGTLLYRTIDRKGPSRGERGRERQSMQEWLGLSPEQEEHIEVIREKFSPRYKSIRDEMHLAREKNFSQYMSGTPDTVSLFRQVDEIGRLQAAMEKLVIRQMMEESRVFTEEQREIFMKRVKERMGRRNRSYRKSSENGKNRGPQKEKNTETKKEDTP